jgi:hypothetical protein
MCAWDGIGLFHFLPLAFHWFGAKLGIIGGRLHQDCDKIPYIFPVKSVGSILSGFCATKIVSENDIQAEQNQSTGQTKIVFLISSIKPG